MTTRTHSILDNPGARVLRWILFIPSSVLAAGLAQHLVAILNNVSLRFVFIEPDSFLSRVWVHFIGNVVFGAVLIQTH